MARQNREDAALAHAVGFVLSKVSFTLGGDDDFAHKRAMLRVQEDLANPRHPVVIFTPMHPIKGLELPTIQVKPNEFPELKDDEFLIGIEDWSYYANDYERNYIVKNLRGMRELWEDYSTQKKSGKTVMPPKFIIVTRETLEGVL